MLAMAALRCRGTRTRCVPPPPSPSRPRCNSFRRTPPPLPSPRPNPLQAALAEPSAAGCHAYVVPLRRTALAAELSAVARFAAAAGPAHAFLLTAEAAPTPAYAAFDLAAAGVGGRLLQAAGSYTAVGNIRMNPDIFAGLVISLLLGAIVLIGVQCTLSVRTPDIMHSFALPAGREY